MFHLKKQTTMNKTNNQQEEFDINNVKVHRTIEGTIFEVVAAILVITTWIIALARHQFNGTFGEQWLTGIIALTLGTVVLLVCCYYPRLSRSSYRLKNFSQVLISIRTCRIMAVEFALAMLCNAISNCSLMVQPIGPRIFIAVIVITALASSFLMRKAK